MDEGYTQYFITKPYCHCIINCPLNPQINLEYT